LEADSRLVLLMVVEEDEHVWWLVIAVSDGAPSVAADNINEGRASKRGSDSRPPTVGLTNGLASWRRSSLSGSMPEFLRADMLLMGGLNHGRHSS